LSTGAVRVAKAAASNLAALSLGEHLLV